MAQAAAVVRPSSGRRGTLSLSGEIRWLVVTLTISSYVTGGEAMDLNALFGSLVPSVGRIMAVIIPNQNARTFNYNTSTKVVTAFNQAGTEVANATNIGAVTIIALIQG